MHCLMPASNFFTDSMGIVTNTDHVQQAHAVDDSAALSLALEMMAHNNQPAHADVINHTLINALSDENNYLLSDADRASKRSQNMTECVGVPSSEHVAEIVGRQGCKIKALRAKTNTYIKTPVRGEDPVFVVTGRKEDVANAKKEILSAADHFSQIRACRKSNLNGSMAPGPPNMPGQVTISVRVPYRVVGLVVGPKGATIKRIQQQTQTYIVTPSRDKEPVFEVSGMPESVDAAKKEIEAHIAMRTGQSALDEETLTAFASSQGISVEQVLTNPDFMSLYRHYSSTYSSPSASTPNSLNAMLSTANFGGSSNLAMNQYNSLVSGHLGSSNTNGLSSALGSSISPIGNGLSNGYSPFSSNSVNGSSLNSVSSLASSLATLSNSSSINQLGGSNNMDLLGTLHNFTSMNSDGLNGLTNGSSSLGVSSALGNHNSQLNCDLSTNFSLLGDTATSLMNSMNRTGRNGLDIGNSLFSSNALSRGNNFDLPTSSALPNVYGIDEGLGSLGSSMGSSPALDQTQNSSAIWSGDNKFSSISSLFGSRALGSISGANSPSQRQSPTGGFHSPARRSSSDPSGQNVSLMSAFSSLQLRDSGKSSSPDSLDFGTPFMTQTMATSLTSTPTSVGTSFLPAPGSTSCTFTSKPETPTDETPSSSPASGHSTDSSGKIPEKVCTSCPSTEVLAAFVPCGHNISCMDCAAKLKEENPICPLCSKAIGEVLMLQKS